MSEKRRGLGRGLGALIPTSSEGKRPVDVFFPSAVPADSPTGDDATPTGGTHEVGTVTAPTITAIDSSGDPTEVAGIGGLSDADLAELDALSAADGDASASGNGTVNSPAGEGSAAGGASRDGGMTSDTGEADGSAAATDASTGAVADEAGADVSRETPTRADVAAPADVDSGLEWTGQAGDDLVPVPGARFAEIPVSSIRPNPRQPRTVFDEGELEELIGSIREIGVLQPIVVRSVPDGDGAFELIMGERRWRATQAAGLTTVPAIIRETDDSDLLRDALLENLHRSALNPLEEAAAYRQLLDDFGCTHEELAERISRSRPQISNTLRLLRLPPLVQRRVAAGVLSAGHARALLGLTDGAEIERLAQRIVAEGLSVRATEEIVALGGLDEDRRAARTPRAGQRSAAIDELAGRLSDRFETRVRVDLGKNKGRLTVEFASVEDLNRILDLMAPEDPGLLRK